MPIRYLTEASIERAVVRRMQKVALRALKLNGRGMAGWPDRLFIMPDGKSIFIEFKRPGGVVSDNQENVIRRLRSAGHEVYVCYSVEAALAVLLK